jgi:putative transposase
LSKVCVSYSYVKSICVSVLRFYDTQVRLCIAGDTQNRSLRLISSFMPSMVLMRRRSLLLRRRSRRWSRGVSEQPGNPERLLGFAHETSINPSRDLRLLGQENSPDPSHLGWYRRFLPHRDDDISLLQLITYRLADSLPQHLLAQLKAKLEALPPEEQEAESRKLIEYWLDAGYGACCLRNPQAAEIIVNNWKYFDGERYDLIAWVVMPNHVHVLVRVYEGHSLGKIVQSWKSYTGKRILALDRARAGARGSQGGKALWMREFWDRYIRDEEHWR